MDKIRTAESMYVSHLAQRITSTFHESAFEDSAAVVLFTPSAVRPTIESYQLPPIAGAMSPEEGTSGRHLVSVSKTHPRTVVPMKTGRNWKKATAMPIR